MSNPENAWDVVDEGDKWWSQLSEEARDAFLGSLALLDGSDEPEVVSLETTVATTDGEVLSLAEILASVEEEDPFARVENLDKLRQVILSSGLTARELQVLLVRYLSGGMQPMPHKKVGAQLGIGRQRAQRLDSAARAKITISLLQTRRRL